jgi:hypothetical protein
MAKTNYVDNDEFFKAILAYRKAIRKAKRLKLEKPRIPDYIGKCFMLIAENMSHKYNFLSYTFRDEMVGDAIEDCVNCVENFDPTKGKNPFAYFSQVCYWAFLHRINREKTQLYVKYKSTEMHGVLDNFDQLESEDGMTRQFEMYDNISEFIQKFEDAKERKKAKAKAKTAKNLEAFLD